MTQQHLQKNQLLGYLRNVCITLERTSPALAAEHSEELSSAKYSGLHRAR